MPFCRLHKFAQIRRRVAVGGGQQHHRTVLELGDAVLGVVSVAVHLPAIVIRHCNKKVEDTNASTQRRTDNDE